MNRDTNTLPPVAAPRDGDPDRDPAGGAPDLGTLTVVGVFDRRGQADAAVRALLDAGHAKADVTVVAQSVDAAPARGAGDTEAGVGSVRGALGGAVVGGVLGLLAAFGLRMDLLGPLTPVALAAGGAVGGGALGAPAGSFAGLGTPTRRAERYEAATRAGGVQVAVNAADEGAAERAREALLRLGARGVQGYQPAL